MSKSITMRDIAQRLGISVAAVSKAMSGKGGVGEELRRKIMRTADEMGYNPDSAARKRAARSGNIGIIVAERFMSDNSFYLRFIHSLSKALQQYGKYALFHTLTWQNEEKAVLPDIFFHQRVDGIIVLGQVSVKYVKAVKNTAIPVVFLDFYDELTSGSCIVCDSFYGSYEITNHLINNGHRSIAFVGNINSTSSIQDRYLGYVKSLIEHRIPLNDRFVISDRTDDGIFIPIELPVVMPTAFVCNCDETACRLITILKENGFRVPEDISVTGFDNSVYSSISVPQITTVEVNTAQMSAMTVEALMARIEDPSHRTGMIQVKGKIVFKESVKSLNYE